MSKVALQTRNNGFIPSVIGRYGAILKANDIEYVWLDYSDDLSFVNGITHYINHFIHHPSQMQFAEQLMPIVERELGQDRVFPNFSTRWHFDDKIKQFLLLKSSGYPIVDTHVFYDSASALSWLESANYPLVFKLKSGAGARNVALVNSPIEASSYVKKMFSGKGVRSFRPSIADLMKNPLDSVVIQRILKHFGKVSEGNVNPYWQLQRGYILFQEFLPDNSYDIRVTTIGDSAFVFKRWNRKDDFRASGSGIIDYESNDIDFSIIDLALKISAEMGFQMMAYDFLVDQSGAYKVSEISYAFVDRAIADCPGYFKGSSENWVEGRVWPQFELLKTFLNMSDLRCPDLSKIKPEGVS